MTQVSERSTDAASVEVARGRARPHWRRASAWATAVGAPTALLAVHSSAYGRWVVDDAAITFAYARSVAAGAGPVLQPGTDPVEGYSNPAWLAILVVGRWLGLFDHGAWFGVPDLVAFPKAVALLCCAGMFAAFHSVSRAVSNRPVLLTVVAGCATAAVPSFAIWTTSGLENSLLAGTAVGIGVVLARAAIAGRLLDLGVAAGSGALAAVAALTRPDGLVYVTAYPVAVLLLLQRRRLLAATGAIGVSVAVFAVPTGAYLWWRVATFGEYLPNTALAKSQGLPGLGDLGRPAELVSYAGWLTVVLVVGVVAAGMLQWGPTRTAVAMLVVPLGLAVAAYAVLQADWMGAYRFAMPVWPLAALAATLAAARVLPQLAVRARAPVAGVGLVAVALTGSTWTAAAETFRAEPTVPMCGVAQGMGASVNEFGRILGVTGGAIATPDIGGVALTSRYEVVDIAGLASREIAAFWRAGDMQGLRDYLLGEVSPEFIEIHGAWSNGTGLLDDPRMTERYVPILMTAARSGWFVRRDLADPARLTAATEHAETVAVPLRAQYTTGAPRSSCGDTLTPLAGPTLG
ncbi:hypothetical protein [Pseudonocardia sp. H11422]|uniref:hypothetical protein n=1 Tax=Pseudonocardia sp. H11422 TaxID=2835866 RepID=UPI002027A9CA|nr:hypothetical protein [Pseudonocardia sp. H11422]